MVGGSFLVWILESFGFGNVLENCVVVAADAHGSSLVTPKQAWQEWRLADRR